MSRTPGPLDHGNYEDIIEHDCLEPDCEHSWDRVDQVDEYCPVCKSWNIEVRESVCRNPNEIFPFEDHRGEHNVDTYDAFIAPKNIPGMKETSFNDHIDTHTWD